MKKINWEAELKKITSTRGKDSARMEITPFRDWRIVVILFFVGISGALSWGVYMLIKINEDSFFVAAPKVVGVTKFNEDGLAKVITTIIEKEARFEALRTEAMTVVDPSI